MGLGGSESAAPWANVPRRIKVGRYPIALDHGETMKSGFLALIG